MRTLFNLRLFFLAFSGFAAALVAGCAMFSAQSASLRQEISLDGPGWRVWLDEKAQWQNDTLYAPGEVPALEKLPISPPTGGWEVPSRQGIAAATPTCVEQLFAKGDPGYQYHGVSWFVKTVNIPAGWQGKTVRLDIARARLRLEVFVNRKLAGYDLCLESPCAFELTKFIEPGKPNELAVRITNPGGSRGFDDTRMTRWGIAYKDAGCMKTPPEVDRVLPSGRDFAGLDTLTLTATEPVYLADIFVMNQLPACSRNLEIRATVRNTTAQPAKRTFRVRIGEVEKSIKIDLPPGDTAAVIPLTVPGAKLWSPDTPNLYTCESVLLNGQQTADTVATRFGFRTFEVKPDATGKNCFYLNGQRFRHRSAIDFGYYSHTGLAATKEQVVRSILAAKAIGHNGINLHRHIGETRMFDAADELGLALYEEPGGMHHYQGEFLKQGGLAEKVEQEKIRRMALYGRNHPSLLIHNLSNEDNYWGPEREKAMRTINAINPAIFVCNASGHSAPGNIPGRVTYAHAQPSGPICHIRPYETEIRRDYQDDHTVGATVFFNEFVFNSHEKNAGKDLFYFGEVACYCGPANWWQIVEQAKETVGSYDQLSSQESHDKIGKAFTDWNLASTGSKLIRSPADVSRQAGRGLMYINGRLSQRIMSNNSADGYAINGWSAHSYCVPIGCTPDWDTWDSAIVDAGRNLKGPAEDYAYWTRPAQVAVFRKSAKYVKPGDDAAFEVCLINEGKIPAGGYTLRFSVTDGAGRKTEFAETRPVTVKGGDIYAQPCDNVKVTVQAAWRAGHITLHAELLDASGKVVADGAEQVLLQNGVSWKADLATAKIAVANWPAAESALKNSGANIFSTDSAEVILAGAPENTNLPIDQLLDRAESGAALIIKFDASWAKILYEKGILSAPVTQWGGQQVGESFGWFSNGWGYFDHFTGDQAVPSKYTLSSYSWEVPGNPVGFCPFESKYRLSAYGLHMARKVMENSAKSLGSTKKSEALPTLLVLLGSIDYGKGKIILAPSYPVDANHAFNDLLFYNMIIKASKKEW